MADDALPPRLTIGTANAFAGGYAFSYTKEVIASETIYVCTKGSQWCLPNEVLVLRCANGTWTAYDTAVNAHGDTLQCRQAVFRCQATNITQPGWYQWETNFAADREGAGLEFDWQGALWAETRVP